MEESDDACLARGGRRQGHSVIRRDDGPGGGLSIVVVTYQSARHIIRFLDTVRRVTPSAEVVVVDNASSDGTARISRDGNRHAAVLELDENVGFGRAANVGAANANGEWLLFANPDVRLESVMLPRANQGRSFGLGAAMLRVGKHRAKPLVRAETTYVEDWVREVLSRFLPPPLARRVGRKRPIAWASGALFLTRRWEFLDVGGFDPRYFMYFEDRDLAARYRLRGSRIRGVTGIVGTHELGSSSSDVPGRNRAAWELVSWLEYIGIWRGQAAADHAAASASVALREISRVIGRGRAPARFRSKVREVKEIMALVGSFDELLPRSEQTYYPHARAAVASARAQGALR